MEITLDPLTSPKSEIELLDVANQFVLVFVDIAKAAHFRGQLFCVAGCCECERDDCYVERDGAAGRSGVDVSTGGTATL